MNKKTIIGVMGPGDNPRKIDVKRAFELGKLIAQEGWIILSGGRNAGVMDAVSKGAKSVGGLTIGILPTGNERTISRAVDIRIITDMGSARNNINVLSSDVVIACGSGLGTSSEIALALKAGKKVILLNDDKDGQKFFKRLGKKNVHVAQNPKEAIEVVKKTLHKD